MPILLDPLQNGSFFVGKQKEPLADGSLCNLYILCNRICYNDNMEFKKVEIHWLDTTYLPGWFNSDELQENIAKHPGQMKTAGWQVGENDTHVFIAQTVGEFSVGNILAIPKCCINGN